MEKNITFKKTFFGGFEREDVMNYIAALTDEFFRYKKETVSKVEEMKIKFAKLEEEYNALLEENKALKAENEDLNSSSADEEESGENIKSLIESLTESMNVLISVLSVEEKSESETEEVTQEATGEKEKEETPETEENEEPAEQNIQEHSDDTEAAEPDNAKISTKAIIPRISDVISGPEGSGEVGDTPEETIDDIINKYS